MKIIDSHAHLEMSQFDEDRAAMLERARAAGVDALLAIGSGTSPAERIDSAIPFAEQHDWIYATIGVHPYDAKAATEEHFAQLDQFARHPRVIAWGEMGLDYHYDEEQAPRDVQQRVFRRQLEQARAAKLPIVIHCRDAWDDCIGILEEDWRPSGLGGIFHCFTATPAEAGADSTWAFWYLSPRTSPTRKCSTCATWRANFRSIAYSRRPIRPSCPRKDAAASATSPPSW